MEAAGEREKEEAFITLTTNDRYALGALVLARSLRRVATRKKLVCMITNHVSLASSLFLYGPMCRMTVLSLGCLRKVCQDFTFFPTPVKRHLKVLAYKERRLLEEVFDSVVMVTMLSSDNQYELDLLQRPDLSLTFTKLHCWTLTQYSKGVFLDADTLVLQNIDDLMEREELSAAPDCGWPDCFNSGVFVFKPSLDTFKDLVAFAKAHGTFDGGDQGLLNSYFKSWAREDINKHLPFTYNTVAHAFYSYLPAYERFKDDVKVCHFIGPVKPWNFTFDSTTRQVLDKGDTGFHKEYLSYWWEIFMNEVASRVDYSAVSLMVSIQGHSGYQGHSAPKGSESSGFVDNYETMGYEFSASCELLGGYMYDLQHLNESKHVSCHGNQDGGTCHKEHHAQSLPDNACMVTNNHHNQQDRHAHCGSHQPPVECHNAPGMHHPEPSHSEHHSRSTPQGRHENQDGCEVQGDEPISDKQQMRLWGQYKMDYEGKNAFGNIAAKLDISMSGAEVHAQEDPKIDNKPAVTLSKGDDTAQPSSSTDEEKGSTVSPKLSKEQRRHRWEHGEMEYTGADSFSKIQQQLDAMMNSSLPPVTSFPLSPSKNEPRFDLGGTDSETSSTTGTADDIAWSGTIISPMDLSQLNNLSISNNPTNNTTIPGAGAQLASDTGKTSFKPVAGISSNSVSGSGSDTVSVGSISGKSANVGQPMPSSTDSSAITAVPVSDPITAAPVSGPITAAPVSGPITAAPVSDPATLQSNKGQPLDPGSTSVGLSGNNTGNVPPAPTAMLPTSDLGQSAFSKYVSKPTSSAVPSADNSTSTPLIQSTQSSISSTQPATILTQSTANQPSLPLSQLSGTTGGILTTSASPTAIGTAATTGDSTTGAHSKTK